MTRAIVAGTDQYSIATAIADAGHEVARVDLATGDTLDATDIGATDVYVLTELDQATSIPVAKERNPDLRVVVYADDSLPDFVRRQTDLALDPALFDPADVAAELSG